MSVNNSWDSLGFEKHIQAIFRGNGYEVIVNEKENEPGLDFITRKDEKSYAVQIKAWKKRVPANTVGRFIEFCNEKNFDRGIIVSLNGFTDASHALALKDGQKKFFLGEYDNEKHIIKFLNEASKANTKEVTLTPEPIKNPIKIAIFTAKGGVGKTTISAHLAGALTLSGKNVALIDIDPDSNLYNLSESNSLIIPNQKTGKAHTLKIFKEKQWLEITKKQQDVIISDCSPVFSLNPKKLMQETDIFICPVTLSPLSVGLNAEVLHRSYRQIRDINKEAKIFILINGFKPDISGISVKLLAVIKLLTNKVIDDKYFQLIPTDVVAIRDSALLRNFGDNQKLEFLNVAGRCYPRQDFLALADYLIENEYLHEA